MNYLAHFYLAQQSPGLLTGAFLGDYIKGSLNNESNLHRLSEKNLPVDTKLGIRLHRHIDAQFDCLEFLEPFKANCPKGTRRYSGIFLDLYCDHLLCNRWDSFSQKPIDQFESEVVKLLKRTISEENLAINPRAFLMLNAFENHSLLSAYKSRTVIERSIERIGQRLSVTGLDGLLAPLWKITSDIDETFEQIIHQMQLRVERFLEEKANEI